MKISAEKNNDSFDNIFCDINGSLMKTMLAKINSVRNTVKRGG